MFKNLIQQQASKSAFRRYAHKTYKPDPEAARLFKESIQQVEEHASHTTTLWKKITWFVAVPALVATTVNTYFVEKEHAEHRKHLAHVSDEDWPKAYEYQNIRTKPFFWGDGDKTLFWNPVINRHVKE